MGDECSTPTGKGVWSESISLGVSAFKQASKDKGASTGNSNLQEALPFAMRVMGIDDSSCVSTIQSGVVLRLPEGREGEPPINFVANAVDEVGHKAAVATLLELINSYTCIVI